MPGPKRIELEKQLLVEGRDCECFFYPFLEHLGISDIQIQDFGGVKHLASGWMKAFVKASGFKRGLVQSVGIVRDVETQPDDAFASVCSTLRTVGLPEPQSVATPTVSNPSVSVFLLPDASTPNGMLETLLLRAVSGDPTIACIDRFIQCVENRTGRCPSPVDKARVITYLASRRQIDFPPLIGYAARAGYWNFDDPIYDDLKSFLAAL